MKVLIVGKGGREHALAEKISQSPRLTKLYAAPGNPGIGEIAELVDIDVMNIKGLKRFALERNIDITIVGPEKPLDEGIVDVFEKAGLACFGPKSHISKAESSKVFAKKFMQDSRIPTAGFHVFHSYTEALIHVARREIPYVVKADGLADGKGVIVCRSHEDGVNAIVDMMIHKVHGKSGEKVVVEDFLIGYEISTHALCDGKTARVFPASQDHKPIFDNDQGPNTGGMGAYAPVPWFTDKMMDFVKKSIVQPTLSVLAELHHPFTGLLYPGLMMVKPDDIRVLEFNIRFGDPEIQVLLPLLKSDLLEVIEACVTGTLSDITLEWDPGSAICVVMASKGYPGQPELLGSEITGIEDAEKIPGVKVLHAGTTRENGKLVTAGGRVLNVVAYTYNLQHAIEQAYNAVKAIHFEGAQWRNDIGAKGFIDL